MPLKQSFIWRVRHYAIIAHLRFKVNTHFRVRVTLAWNRRGRRMSIKKPADESAGLAMIGSRTTFMCTNRWFKGCALPNLERLTGFEPALMTEGGSLPLYQLSYSRNIEWLGTSPTFNSSGLSLSGYDEHQYFNSRILLEYLLFYTT